MADLFRQIDDDDDDGDADAGLRYMSAGWGAVPLPPGEKKPPAPGCTGHGAADFNGPDYCAWRDDPLFARGNVGIRMPDDVIGLDVDQYGTKRGDVTLARLEEDLGPLPATWRSSARSTGGILFFRVPPGLSWEREAGPGIDIIQRTHRYAVVWPSIHPEGGQYRWTRRDGAVALNEIPNVADLPMLPDAWVAAFSKGERVGDAAVEAMSTDATMAWIEEFPHHVVCGMLRTATETHLAQLANLDGASAHDTLVRAYGHLIRLALEGHLGLVTCLRKVGRAFVREVTGEHRGVGASRRLTEGAARVESRSVLRWSAAAHRDDPRIADCRCAEASSAAPSAQDGAPAPTEIALSSELATIRNVGNALGTGSLGAMFRQAGQLVWVPSLETGTWTSGNVVRPISNKHALQSTLINHAFVYQTNDNGERREAAIPRQWLDSIVHDVDSLPSVRDVEEVITSPTLLRDGSLIQTPGYRDGVLYLPGDGYNGIAVPDAPTLAEARSAAATILSLIEEFPFTSADAKANYLALLVAPLIRRTLPDPLPLAVFSAPAKGSGKSLLAEGLVLLHGGALIPGWPSAEELPKKITSTLLSPGAVAVFDNVRSRVAGESLEALLTSARHRDRVMGSHRHVDLPNNRLWGVTSNNATIGDDIARRMIAVEIDPRMERPYERTGFKIGNWKGHVVANREELVAALLTMTLYALSKGPPAPVDRSDSFAGFVSLTQHILASCEIPGTVMSLASIESVASPDADDIADFLFALADVEDEGSFKSGEWFVLKDLITLIGGAYTPHASEAVSRLQEECKAHGMTRRGDLNAKVLGGWLSKWKNYRVAGMCLECRKPLRRGNTREWRLSRGEG